MLQLTKLFGQGEGVLLPLNLEALVLMFSLDLHEKLAGSLPCPNKHGPSKPSVFTAFVLKHFPRTWITPHLQTYFWSISHLRSLNDL